MPAPVAFDPDRSRFVVRARVILLARLGLVAMVLVGLLVPAWSELLGLNSPLAAAGCALVAAYSIVALTLLDSKWAQVIVFGALCLDLFFVVYLVVSSGGLHSPLIAIQLIYTLFFTLTFPKPLGTLPPLLVLPIIARIDLLLFSSNDWLAIFLLLIYAALNAAIVVAIVYLNERERRAEREVARLQEERKELAVAEERARLAREIHDGIGAALSGLVLQADYLRTRTNEPEVGAELQDLRQSAQEAIEELRRSVSMLRADFDLGPYIEEYAQALGARHGLEVEVDLAGAAPPRDAVVQLAVFRIAQEALTNVVRHAKAKHVTVRAEFGTSELRLVVRDDGRGFESDSPQPTPADASATERHYGLENMRDRARSIGGSLTVGSKPGEGTTVELRMPRPPAATD